MKLPSEVIKWINTGKIDTREECWVWSGCLNTDGYPKIFYKGNANGKGHRVVYQLFNPEENIEGKVIRHTCDNILCVNPAHLVSGTSTDNMKDRSDRHRTHGQVSKEEIYAVKITHSHGYKQKAISIITGIGYRRVEYILKHYIRS